MSHISEQRTTIKNVHEAVLQETLELIAKVTPGIRISGTAAIGEGRVTSYEGENVVCDVAIHVGDKLHRGLGLRFRGSDGLKFVGDSYQQNQPYESMKELILSTYQVVAVQKALAFMNYKTEITASQNNRVRVEGVRA